MKNVLSKVGLDVHKEKVLLALITPHTFPSSCIVYNYIHNYDTMIIEVYY